MEGFRYEDSRCGALFYVLQYWIGSSAIAFNTSASMRAGGWGWGVTFKELNLRYYVGEPY